MCLINSDQTKYGTIVEIFKSERSLKNDQFPKTNADGHNVLSNHLSPKAKYKKEKDTPTPKSEEEAKALAFAQTKLKGNVCFACGKKNCYVSMLCPRKDNTPCAEWDISKKKTAKPMPSVAVQGIEGSQECIAKDTGRVLDYGLFLDSPPDVHMPHNIR